MFRLETGTQYEFMGIRVYDRLHGNLSAAAAAAAAIAFKRRPSSGSSAAFRRHVPR